MKHLFFIVLICILSIGSLQAQNIFINGKEGDRPLVWSDFQGRPDAGSPYFATTAWGLSFGYDDVKFKGDTALFQNLKIKLEMSADKSWVKKGKETDGLLKHEQGHFDIGRLCLMDIMHQLNTTTFQRPDFQAKIRAVFSETIQKYKTLDAKYDAETNHSINNEQQQKWNGFLLSEEQRLKGKSSRTQTH
jgi:hypothetical protein